MSVEAVQRALRAEHAKDHGACYYCGGYAYVMPGNWLRHLRDKHPDTIRLVNVELALAVAATVPEDPNEMTVLETMRGQLEADRDG